MQRSTNIILVLVFVVVAVVTFSVTWLYVIRPSNNNHNQKASHFSLSSLSLSSLQRIQPKTIQMTHTELAKHIQDQSQFLFIRNSQLKKAHAKWNRMEMLQLAKLLQQHNIRMRLMISPTGIVGWYDTQQVTVHVDPHTKQITGTSKVHKNIIFPLYHIQHDGDPDNLETFINGDQNPQKTRFFIVPEERYYFRTLASPTFWTLLYDTLPACIQENANLVENVNFYVSGRGIITNLHVDGKSGIILQLKGRKRVYVWPAQYKSVAHMYPTQHPLNRRSQIDNRLTNETLEKYAPELARAPGYEFILEPQMWLYIPSQWLHYVETLDPETYSVIIRFQK